ncbi:MAG: hypothetical protein K8F91_14080, partial [Candidatus Obscuribacterales bacterium]|nr:hypothetical protein [Candidatus Obscuribacterales bacterium]
DIFVEYAKESDEDILIKITAFNRGPNDETLHLLPTFWFRNTWSWMDGSTKPIITTISDDQYSAVHARHTDPDLAHKLSEYNIYFDSQVPLIFTENESNNARLFNSPNTSPYVKDAFHDYVIHGKSDAVNPEGCGTKMAAHYQLDIAAGECKSIRIRFSTGKHKEPMKAFDEILALRLAEADEFYEGLAPRRLRQDPERLAIVRAALSGMLWGKQFFHYDVDQWLREHGAAPFCGPRELQMRNSEWFHMFNEDIISMPDKWEYPWYAAWDLAFHIMPLNMIDPDFAKSQLEMMLKSSYLHPNGQIPAYEWNFGDVNPPVHAFATYHAYLYDREQHDGIGDRDFLKYAFSKLLVNFTWWVNRKDPRGHNVFEGG